MKALGLVVSEKKIFLCFSHCKSMGVNDPRGGAIFHPRGMIGRIYKEDHYTLLHIKYESFGPCGFGEEDFFMFKFDQDWPCYLRDIQVLKCERTHTRTDPGSTTIL